MLKKDNLKNLTPYTMMRSSIMFFHELLIQLQLVYSSYKGQFIIQLDSPLTSLPVRFFKDLF